MITGHPAHIPWLRRLWLGRPNSLAAYCGFASNAKMPEAPAEVLEVPHGLLSRTRESGANQLAYAVSTSLDDLGQWLSWATEEATDVQAQRRRCREAGAHWADGSEYAYVLRPRQSEDVIGGFDLWRISPGAVELGYWVHVDSPGAAMPPRARRL
jgi:hypothetical protein